MSDVRVTQVHPGGGYGAEFTTVRFASAGAESTEGGGGVGACAALFCPAVSPVHASPVVPPRQAAPQASAALSAGLTTRQPSLTFLFTLWVCGRVDSRTRQPSAFPRAPCCERLSPPPSVP